MGSLIGNVSVMKVENSLDGRYGCYQMSIFLKIEIILILNV